MKFTSIVFVILLINFSIVLSQSSELSINYFTGLGLEEGKNILEQCSRASPRNVKNIMTVSDSLIQLVKQDLHQLDTMRMPHVGGIKKSFYYAVQMIGYTAKKNQYIYLNVLAIDEGEPGNYSHYENWKEKAIVICDGGMANWGVVYNLNKQKFEDLQFNGP